MPTITRISEQRRAPNRRNIFLDGKFAFGCNVTVIARFRLREGLTIDQPQLREIEFGQVRQECFDAALRLLTRRLHSQAELLRKLKQREWGDSVLDSVMQDLSRLGYLDDDRFARAKALSAAQYKKQGRRRVQMELIKSSVKSDVAQRALDDVFAEHDSTAIARQLAEKQAARLRKLDPIVARRRLAGMLQRRGFDYDSVKPVIDQVLGDQADVEA